MKTIRLQDTVELRAHEDLPKVPELAQRYLDTKERQTEGKHFRIVIDHESNPTPGAGIAYSNALQIEKYNGKSWSQVYSTGMMQYRGAYAHEIDDWDLSLNDPAIFEESENEVVYAVRTDAGNVKVFRFKQPKLLVTFNARDYKATQERIELLQSVINDAEAFRSYVSKKLSYRWRIASKIALSEDNCQIFDATGQKLENSDYGKVAEKGDIVVLLASHSDRDYDPIVDSYQLFVWVKGKGLGFTDTYRTGLCHPGGKFYSVGINFEATITNRGRNFLNLTVKVGNRRQKWNESRNFHVEWKGTDPSEFERKIEEAMERVVNAHQHDHPLYKPTRITESVNDAERQTAAWILFEQIDTDRGHQDSEGWLGDQFRYSLWVVKDGKEPKRLYEDHAYIRPRSKSEITRTRGRDCTLKDLRIDDNTITVSHLKGDRVEEQEPVDLTFTL